MSELLDRRARKKARTREQIRGIAHRLFADRGFDAVTIADVAREADVAVQTVFNHFATKEELFFDGRVTWVEGPAQAVRERGDEAPLQALRRYLVELAGALVASMVTEERRRYIATVEASEALMSQERENVFEAERRLAAALTEAWADTRHAAGTQPLEPSTGATITAAIWLSAIRALIMGHRVRVTEGASPRDLATAVEALAAGLLTQLEATAGFVRNASVHAVDGAPSPSATGWPQTDRQVG